RKGAPFLAAHSVARGAEKWIDIACHPTPEPVIAWAHDEKVPLVATHPDGELTPGDLATMPKLALVLGSEREGIQEKLAGACTARVRVPMRGFAESLNVSVTAAILVQAATTGRHGDLTEAARTSLYARGLYLSVPRAQDVLVARPGDSA
ncbi:MAG: TrmH family RNA methyltransferase, partial [Polyangiaceae bacterium]